MTELNIRHESTDTNGRFFIALDGGLEAQMTYQKLGENAVAIDHTFVPPEFRGHDIAARLVTHGVETLGQSGIKIKPVCSYVVAQFRRHEDWQSYLIGSARSPSRART